MRLAHNFHLVSDNKRVSDAGWHIKLKIKQQIMTWCIDTGAQVTIMPESVYRESFGELRAPDRELVGAGDSPLETVGMANMKLSLGNTCIVEQVYVVKGATKLLLGIPEIRKLGLIPEIKGAYSIRALESKPVEKAKVETEKPARITTLPATKEGIMKAYPKLFTGLGKLQGEYTIKLREGVKPHALHTPRRVPLPLMDKVKAEIDRMVKDGVIEPVDGPTDWCSGMVVVPKQTERVRICVDMTRVNKAVQREYYIMPKVEKTLGCITQGTVFSKLDANAGFNQIVLSDESSDLTTFITPFGRFRFRRCPYGISSAPEYFQKQMDRILEGLEGVVCHMDDILVAGRNRSEHDERLVKVLDRLQSSGLTLNPEKCSFAQTRLEYLGQVIDSTGIRQDPAKVKAIREMASPTDVSELRRFLGMINQQMKFVPDLAERTKPLRDLLSKNTAWIWGEAQKKAFSELKQELQSDRVLAMYDCNKETLVSADASSYGIGAVMMQRQQSGDMRPVAFASRSMTVTETRYAQIEKEALAITWACEHWEALAVTWACEHWDELLVGMRFSIETDHKPLVPLLSTKLIDELPVCIQRYRMRLMRFDFSIKHVPGKQLFTADHLSRSPIPQGDSSADKKLRDDVRVYVNSIMLHLPASDRRLEQIRQETRKDATLLTIMNYVSDKWPEKGRLYGQEKKYWQE